MRAPLAIDLYAGLGGWAEGLMAAEYRVVGFDNERHVYGDHAYPAQLVIQDVLTLHGSQFADASLIVASPPCQKYSYMAMPWSRAKALAEWYREDEARIAELNALFNACFRIQREAIEAAGHHIPLVVENVRGAQPWVGRARWHHGSYYLWGDVPALMPIVRRQAKVGGLDWSKHGRPDYKTSGAAGCFRDSALKQGGDWFSTSGSISRTTGGRSVKRKAASAMIAKIPYDLAHHIGRCWHPEHAKRQRGGHQTCSR